MRDIRRTNPNIDDRGYLEYGYGLRCFQSYGINVLTGEACGYGGRLLCDLDETGVGIIEEFFGQNFRTGNGWNNQEKTAASIMLPRSIWGDLAVFCLLKDGWQVVVLREEDWTAIGFSYSDWMEVKDRFYEVYKGLKVYFSQGTAGLRNRHEFTGRVE